MKQLLYNILKRIRFDGFAYMSQDHFIQTMQETINYVKQYGYWEDDLR